MIPCADHYGGIAKPLKTLCAKSQAMRQRFGRIAAARRDGLQAAKLQQELEDMSRLKFCMSASLLAAVTVTIFAAPAAAQRVDPSTIYLYQGADRDQRLLEAAKKEGTLTFYTSMQTPESGPLSAAFEKKYGIKV